MNKKLICLLVIFCMLLSVQNVVGPETTSSGSSGGSGGGGGGGSKQVDIDRLLKAVEDGKKNKPEKFEELKTLLWKDPITSENYTLPTVLLYYGGNNTTVSRTEKVEIITVIKNNNLPEMRRMLDLYLEAKEPGSSEYRQVNLFPNKIQANEYNAKTNITQRIWNDLQSFAYLKQIGEVRLRVNASDGVNKWSTASYKDLEPPFYSELVFNVTNSLPRMSQFNVTPGGSVRYNDPIEYKADIDDEDGDMLNVTLHILDENGNEIRNETLNTKPGPVSFKANEYGFFKEDDAGKNFTYYYSYDDGINSTARDPEEPLTGPSLRKGAKLAVDRLGFVSASENYYWWDRYGFSVRAKNLNPEEYDVSFTLSTRTEDGKWTTVESKTEKIGPNPVTVYFNQTKPFQVTDAGKTFSYRIKYSEYDQSGRDNMEQPGAKIDAKIVPYKIYNWIMILNMIPMLALIMLGSFYIERKLKKGIEAHEKSGGGSEERKEEIEANSGKSIIGSFKQMLRRK
ncbi:MAG: hypothetical protein GX463_05775 [Methanothrix sp.]|nr:hypothetical protein [Methanothrix sp.]